jgi:hypothetical protein
LNAALGAGTFADFSAVINSALTDDGTGTNPVTTNALAAFSNPDTGAAAVAGALAVTTTATGSPGYYVEYPEDQQLAGISFATNLAGVAVSGEVTHKLDVPFQINSTQLLGAVLTADAIKALVLLSQGITDEATANASLAASAALQAGLASKLGNSFDLEAALGADGSSLEGFKTFDVTQAQVTAIKLFDQVLGANRYALVAEAGYTYVHDFDENDALKFDGSCADNAAGDQVCVDTVTEGSWGYRLRLSGDYSDVFAGVNLSPVLSFAHDVEGVAPAPGGNFLEDRRTLGLALNAEYANMYTAGISYTMYEGSETSSLDDRDYAALTLGVQF